MSVFEGNFSFGVVFLIGFFFFFSTNPVKCVHNGITGDQKKISVTRGVSLCAGFDHLKKTKKKEQTEKCDTLIFFNTLVQHTCT